MDGKRLGSSDGRRYDDSELPRNGLALTFGEDAGVAQLAEQLLRKQCPVSEIEIGPKRAFDQLFKNN
jgi:hypothetical protein